MAGDACLEIRVALGRSVGLMVEREGRVRLSGWVYRLEVSSVPVDCFSLGYLSDV